MSSIAASFTTDAGPVRSYTNNLGLATRAFLAALLAAKPAAQVAAQAEAPLMISDPYDFLKRDDTLVYSIFSVRGH
ncbi:MAG: hypothetical protein V4754_18100 [Pseudomonadota bacterium]